MSTYDVVFHEDIKSYMVYPDFQKFVADTALDDDEVEGLREGDDWDAFDQKRADFQTQLYRVKRDVVKYHCRLLKSCFLSTKDAATLPAGYKAMYAALETAKKAPKGSVILAMLPDTGERYLSTLLFQNLWDEASAMKAE